MALLTFKTTVKGATKVKRTLEAYAVSISSIFAKDRLESLLLKRTKERFLPLGSSPRAQTDPSGKKWKKLSENTLRKQNTNRSQVLVDSKDLWNAISIVRKNMNESVLASPTGGGFSIGVKRGDPAEDYARAHQFGGLFGKNNLVRLPARRFLGISKEDVIAVDNSIVRLLKKHGIGVSL